MPDGLVVTNGFESFKNSEAVLFAIPSRYMRSTCELLKNKGISLDGKLIISTTKGMESNTFLRMYEVIEDNF
ncbi:hypothetical protein AGMMS49921_07130 [Endomicrobiia bacterium]|nr:hypothetical protein AGMMS49921_07130 [Endomicrobiia bacterium]